MGYLAAVPPSVKACRFCDYFARPSIEHGGIDLPWLKNDQYAALASIGGFVPGWSLICPVEHKLNASDHYRKQEFWEFAQDAASIIAKRFGTVRFFEHGACSYDSLTSCGTAHAHLHVVPLKFSLLKAISESASAQKLIWQDCYAKDIAQLSQGREYLFATDRIDADLTHGKIALVDIGVSQFFRKLIAEHLGTPGVYDYKLNPSRELSDRTARDLWSDAQKDRNNLACAL